MADRNGYIGRAPGDSAVTVARQTFSPTGVTTDFTFASGYTVGYLDLFLNGTKLIEGVDYNATDTSTISLVSAAINGDVLEGVAYKAFNLGDGSRIGIQSAGTLVGNVNTLNFVGVGNSISLNSGTIDILIEGGGGAGAAGTWTNYDGVTGVTTTKKVKIQNNLEVTGVTTSTGGFVGNVTGNATGLTGTPNIIVGSVTGTTGSFSSNVSIGGTLTYEDVTNIDSVGIVTARTGVRISAGGLVVAGVSTFSSASTFNSTTQFNQNAAFANDKVLNFGGSSNGRILYVSGTNSFDVRVPGGSEDLKLGAGTNVRITNENGLTDRAVFDASGVRITGIVTATGSVQVGSGQSFGSSTGSAAVYYGDGSNLTNLPAAGLTTEALVSSGIVTTLNLTAAQDHKVTASGITTITVSGGTEADSHTVRIINSGITTVGFSTHFLFPSGSAPSLPTASGAISLISFTVNRVGGAGTQLLAGASLNFS
ncbi:hypothetical protein N9991_00125 [bacterium]|nr:hypothetical protein [bacterium]